MAVFLIERVEAHSAVVLPVLRAREYRQSMFLADETSAEQAERGRSSERRTYSTASDTVVASEVVDVTGLGMAVELLLSSLRLEEEVELWEREALATRVSPAF